MRTPSISLSTFGILAAGLIAPSLQAQTSSATPVIGYYKQTAKGGVNTFVSGFVTKKEFQGQSTSVAAAGANSTINQTGAAFGTFTNHYVELLDDPSTGPVEAYAGVILDILSNTGTAITVKGNITAYGQNLRYCVRKHATLGSLLPTASGVAEYDGVSVITTANPAAPEQGYYFEGGHWKDANGVVSDNVVVYPSQGFVYSAGADVTLTLGGNEVSYVKEGQTVAPLYASIPNLVGPVDPLVGPPPAGGPGVNTWAVNSLVPQLQDYDGVTLYPSDGSGVEAAYYVEGGQLKDTNGAPAAVTSPVGSSVFLSVAGDGTVKFSPVTVAP